ncbi:MAG: hypothetical protein ACYC06_00305 [Ilumatobacteraceae bacterium]
MVSLNVAAEAFAGILTEVVNGTVTSDARFVVTLFKDHPNLAWVFPEGSTPGKRLTIPVNSGLKSDQPIRLSLDTRFQVRLDDFREHLAVQSSVFALVLDEKSKRPAVRVKYDRDRGSEPDDSTPGLHRRSAAHVQIHGSSEELAYIQGLHGNEPLRTLDKFHIPVGGRRFRPTLEDFIEFLWSERLIGPLHVGWQQVLAQHRSNWLDLQLRTAVRGNPTTAIAQLEAMGYKLNSPPNGNN